MSDKIIIFTFTDPMMGLSYECEPIFRKLETHFENKIEFKFIMSALVRNVFDLVDENYLALGKKFAIEKYNTELAKIYESEEKISGMPIIMKNFKLFSEKNISSIPLNIAFKAAQIVDYDKSENFLYNLRYATIVETRQTTKFDEILKVVKKTGVDIEKFLQVYDDGTAEKNFNEDLKICQTLNIHRLPSYMIQYKNQSAFVSELIGYDVFVAIIDKLSDFEVKPRKIKRTQENLKKLLQKHPLISQIELKEAFDFEKLEEVDEFIAPIIEENFVEMKKVKNTYFLEVKK